ncbi:MAG: DUF1292 domain-containing protein [Bacillota bacterium]|nr:DUF1292 domain-containing protein [Bacillota bacterium]
MKLLMDREKISIEGPDGMDHVLDVLFRFDHNAKSYAVFIELEDKDMPAERELYVVRVIEDENGQKFIPLEPFEESEVMPIVWLKMTGIELSVPPDEGY